MATDTMPVMPERRAGPMSIFAEYSFVVLAHEVAAGGVKYPSGTRGVVVHRHSDGVGYEVEFERPRFGVLTLTANDLIAT